MWQTATSLGSEPGYSPGSRIDRAGLFGTASLRAAFGGFDQPQNLHKLVSPASGVFDLRSWRAARHPGSGSDE